MGGLFGPGGRTRGGGEENKFILSCLWPLFLQFDCKKVLWCSMYCSTGHYWGTPPDTDMARTHKGGLTACFLVTY